MWQLKPRCVSRYRSWASRGRKLPQDKSSHEGLEPALKFTEAPLGDVTSSLSPPHCPLQHPQPRGLPCPSMSSHSPTCIRLLPSSPFSGMPAPLLSASPQSSLPQAWLRPPGGSLPWPLLPHRSKSTLASGFTGCFVMPYIMLSPHLRALPNP